MLKIQQINNNQFQNKDMSINEYYDDQSSAPKVDRNFKFYCDSPLLDLNIIHEPQLDESLQLEEENAGQNEDKEELSQTINTVLKHLSKTNSSQQSLQSVIQIEEFLDEQTLYQEKKNKKLTKEELLKKQLRMEGVNRYLSKKTKRIYKKRVIYLSRKKQAEGRLRVGGRFQKKQRPQQQSPQEQNQLEKAPSWKEMQSSQAQSFCEIETVAPSTASVFTTGQR